jgi:simple sugar transport system ATP-binding protein
VAFRRAGGAFVPRDRRREGIFPGLTLAENLALSGPGGFWLDPSRLRDDARTLLSRFGVKASSERARARELSGGNQQKLVLARELARSPRALVAIHPTRGLDVGAAAELRGRLVACAQGGCGVLVVTADPEEAQELGGPIRVVYRDRLTDDLPARTPLEALLRRMGGLTT